jgi:hypothetical protein
LSVRSSTNDSSSDIFSPISGLRVGEPLRIVSQRDYAVALGYRGRSRSIAHGLAGCRRHPSPADR